MSKCFKLNNLELITKSNIIYISIDACSDGFEVKKIWDITWIDGLIIKWNKLKTVKENSIHSEGWPVKLMAC